MKTEIEEYGFIVSQVSVTDLCKLLETFYPQRDEDYLKLFAALSKGFSGWPVSTRQTIVNSLVKQHLSRKEAKHIVEQMDNLVTDMWL